MGLVELAVDLERLLEVLRGFFELCVLVVSLAESLVVHGVAALESHSFFERLNCIIKLRRLRIWALTVLENLAQVEVSHMVVAINLNRFFHLLLSGRELASIVEFDGLLHYLRRLVTVRSPTGKHRHGRDGEDKHRVKLHAQTLEQPVKPVQRD